MWCSEMVSEMGIWAAVLCLMWCVGTSRVLLRLPVFSSGHDALFYCFLHAVSLVEKGEKRRAAGQQSRDKKAASSCLNGRI